MSGPEPQQRRALWKFAPALAGAGATAAALFGLLAVAAVLGGASASQGRCGVGPPGPVIGVPSTLRPLFAGAAGRYMLGAEGAAILAGLTSVESDFGRNMGPSSAGAIGWTQFMPGTWTVYGVDADGDGLRDPFNAADAIYSAARYLHASGAPKDWYRALFAYNHADWYVAEVLRRAERFSGTAEAEVNSHPVAATLVVGDSLEVGTFPELRKLVDGVLVGDFVGGRPSRRGVEALRRLIATRDFTNLVFDLGTNDATAAELRTSLRAVLKLAAGRRVYLATVNSPWDERAKNRLLATVADRHDNVTLIQWHRVSGGLQLADGVHGAYPQRARLIARLLDAEAGAPSAWCDSPVVATAVGGVRRVSGGGRLVPIPGFPGEQIDSRILADVRYVVRTYHLAINDGYSTSPVHKANGEHPLGLAIDVVPGPGGTWDDVDRLARWAEPRQNAPRPPFRWVGYNGDANHGRGNHLHLSWNHAPAPSRRPPAQWVEVLRLDG